MNDQSCGGTLVAYIQFNYCIVISNLFAKDSVGVHAQNEHYLDVHVAVHGDVRVLIR